MTQLIRSIGQTEQPSSEVFTNEDYHEALCMSYILDSEAQRIGIPLDERSQGNVEKREYAVGELNFPDTEEVIEHVEGLLKAIEDSCVGVSKTVVSDVPKEAESFIGINARTMFNMKPFDQQLHYIASRFIVEYIEREEERWGVKAETQTWLDAIQVVTKLVQEVPKLTDSIYQTDIPAYTILYREFDEMRRNGEHPLEVYLGRDGIYAYYGRLAQNAARGDNDPVLGEFPLDQAQLVLRPDPRYIVYSRGVKDNSDKGKKLLYVKQFIDADSEPHFYDTGYSGSIPEDIMKILGFKPDEIDSRIHLLSTHDNKRRLRGLPNNIDIGIIEDHPKDEEPANGLVEDGETIKHVTKPTTLEEQFRFMVVRDVLIRHFWLKEYSEISSQMAHEAITT